MQKDYAKKKQHKQALVEQGWRERLLLVSVLVLVVFGGWYGYDMYKQHSNKLNLAAIKSFFYKKSDTSSHLTSQPGVSEIKETNHDNEIQFNFYTELPNDKIVLDESRRDKQQPVPPKIPHENPVTVTPTQLSDIEYAPNTARAEVQTMSDKTSKLSQNPTSTIPQYIVQIAAYRNASAAGEMRISLLLAGFEVNIVKKLDNAHNQLYLIQQGPYSSMGEAKTRQKKLKEKGIESVVQKIT